MNTRMIYDEGKLIKFSLIKLKEMKAFEDMIDITIECILQIQA